MAATFKSIAFLVAVAAMLFWPRASADALDGSQTYTVEGREAPLTSEQTARLAALVRDLSPGLADRVVDGPGFVRITLPLELQDSSDLASFQTTFLTTALSRAEHGGGVAIPNRPIHWGLLLRPRLWCASVDYNSCRRSGSGASPSLLRATGVMPHLRFTAV
jgi:hypothetical protein